MTLEAKFDTGATNVSAYDAGELPWGYGDDRIFALVRSPDSLYVYWEITDDAIARARARLGAAGAHGWLNLRVYDTTGQEFDGTNANGYFDITIERDARDRFFDLHKPSAAFHVEVGVKTHEGYFHAIARSGRADMPRKGPSGNHALEWLTVTSDAPPAAVAPYRSKFVPRPAPPAPPQSSVAYETEAPAHAPPRIVHGESVEERTWTWTHPAHFEVRWEGPWLSEIGRPEWRLRWLSRDGKTTTSLDDASWIMGPFAEHMLDPSRFEVRFSGDGPVVLEERVSGLEVFGPWQVAIRSFDAVERRTIGAWRVHRVGVEPTRVETYWAAFERVRVHAWERRITLGGASDARALVEGGASELWRLGASERLTVGASEWLALGASELAWAGGSERALGGASAWLFGGASAYLFGGASAFHQAGSSSFMYGGGSPPGSSPASSPYGWR